MRIGIDLGGTKIEAIALDHAGLELGRIRIPTPRGDYDATIRDIASLVAQLEASTAAPKPATVGVGIPGTIVAATGLVKNANSTWLNGRPLQHDLSLALNRPIRCANDANCFTVSEASDGAASGHHVVFGVIIGTGCGGGISLGGHVHAGPNGLAGEWGHVPLPWATPAEYPGPACYCGRSGCIETWISGTGFERDFKAITGRSLRGSAIVTAAATGDPEAAAALDRLLDRIARSLALIVNILDPDAIVLGGGLSNLPHLYDPAFAARLSRCTFGGNTTTPILQNLHGDSSGVRGAAWLWPLT